MLNVDVLYLNIILGNVESSASQEINQESKGYEGIEAITSKPQTQQNVNNDGVDFSFEDDGNRRNQFSSKTKSGKGKAVEIEDFHSDDQLISVVKKRE